MKSIHIFISLLILTVFLCACTSKKEKRQTVHIYYGSIIDSTHHIKFTASLYTGAGPRQIEAETPYSITFNNEPFVITANSHSDTIQLQMECEGDGIKGQVWGTASVGTIFNFPPNGAFGFSRSQ